MTQEAYKNSKKQVVTGNLSVHQHWMSQRESKNQLNKEIIRNKEVRRKEEKEEGEEKTAINTIFLLQSKKMKYNFIVSPMLHV